MILILSCHNLAVLSLFYKAAISSFVMTSRFVSVSKYCFIVVLLLNAPQNVVMKGKLVFQSLCFQVITLYLF